MSNSAMIRRISTGISILFLLAMRISGQDAPDPAAEIFMQAFGDTAESPAQEDTEILLLIRIDGEFSGELSARITADNEVHLPREALFELLEPGLSPEGISGIRESFGGDSVRLEDLVSYGFDAWYDSSMLQVEILTPPELRRSRDLRLRHAPQHIDPADISAAPYSAYMNYYSKAELLYRADGEEAVYDVPLQLNLFPNLQFRRWVLTGGVNMTSYPEKEVELDSLRLIRDFPENGLRLAAGTLDSPSYASIPSVPLDGVGIGTEKALSDIASPYRSLSRELLLEQPAEVSIYLNGRLLKTERLDAGVHNLLDFPYVGGLNEIRIVITEQDGRERTIETIVPFDSGLLRQQEYSFAVSGGTPQHEFSDPLAAGFFSYGLLPRLTGGTALQIDRDTYIGNLSLVSALPFGNLGLGFGASTGLDRDPGIHSRLQYRVAFPSRRSIPSLGVQVEYYDDAYRSSVLSEAPSDYIWRFSSSIGQVLPFSAYASIMTAYALGRGESPDSLQGSLTLLKGFGRSASMSLSFSLNHDTQEGWEWRGHLAFSLSPDNSGQNLQYSQDLKSGEGGLGFSWRDTEDPQQWVYTASVQGYPPASADQTVADMGFHYDAPFLRASINNSLSRTNYDTGSNTTSNRLGAGLGGAVLFAGGNFALSRQVQDSFIMLVPDDELQNELVSVRNSRGSGGTKESRGGVITYSELSSYTPATLQIELPNTSPEVLLKEDIVTLVPSYRSGITVPVRLRHSLFVSGRLLTLQAEPIALQAGELIPLDSPGDERQLFFSDEEGFFQLHDIEAGRYLLVLFSSTGAQIELSIPESPEGRVSLEPLVLPVIRKELSP